MKLRIFLSFNPSDALFSKIGSGPSFSLVCSAALARLAHCLEGSSKLPFKFGDVCLIVFPLVSLLGFKKHCGKIGMQLLNVILNNLSVAIDSILQPPCPLTIPVVSDWIEDLVSLGICQLCGDKTVKALMEGRHSGMRLVSLGIKLNLLPQIGSISVSYDAKYYCADASFNYK